jgi:hypothetical protein
VEEDLDDVHDSTKLHQERTRLTVSGLIVKGGG